MYQDVLMEYMPKTFFTATFERNEIIKDDYYEVYRLKSKYEINARFMKINMRTGEVIFDKDPFEVILDYTGYKFDLGKFDVDDLLSYAKASVVKDETGVEVGARVQITKNGGMIRFFISGGNLTIEKLMDALKAWEKVKNFVEDKICQNMEAVVEEENLAQSQ